MRLFSATGVILTTILAAAPLTPIFAQDSAPKTETTPTPQRWVKANPKGEEFCGLWTGRFRGTHEIRFTVTPDDKGGPNHFRVLYECQQYPNEKPQSGVFVATLDGGGLVVGKMTIFLIEQEPGRGMVHGNFSITPMVADLVRSELKK